MPEIAQLYHAVILEHKKCPRNFGVLESANRTAEGYNPLCGDRLVFYVETEDDFIRKAAFQGSGCAISLASASLLTGSIKGRTVREAEALLARLQAMLASPPDSAVRPDGLGDLAALAGVRAFPARLDCASLAPRTLSAALFPR